MAQQQRQSPAQQTLTENSQTLTQNSAPSTETPPPASNGNGQAIAVTKPKTEIEAVSYQLEQLRPKFALTLPKQIKPEAFERVVLTAINMQPALLSADRRSLFNACMRAAQDGLIPDGREGALVIFNTKVKDENGKEQWIKKIQFMPMVYGIIKKLRQSGEIAAVSARVVYSKEIEEGRFKFIIDNGEERLTHEPILTGDRGDPALVYATARFKDGTVQNEPLTMADVAKIKAVSRSKDRAGNHYGPWVDWEEEMMKKSAIRRLSKYLPLSAEDRRTVERDDELTDFARLKHEAVQNIESAAGLLGAPEDEPETGDPPPDDAL